MIFWNAPSGIWPDNLVCMTLRNQKTSSHIQMIVLSRLIDTSKEPKKLFPSITTMKDARYICHQTYI
jgi:hypothetical protein